MRRRPGSGSGPAWVGGQRQRAWLARFRARSPRRAHAPLRRRRSAPPAPAAGYDLKTGKPVYFTHLIGRSLNNGNSLVWSLNASAWGLSQTPASPPVVNVGVMAFTTDQQARRAGGLRAAPDAARAAAAAAAGGRRVGSPAPATRHRTTAAHHSPSPPGAPPCPLLQLAVMDAGSGGMRYMIPTRAPGSCCRMPPSAAAAARCRARGAGGGVAGGVTVAACPAPCRPSRLATAFFAVPQPSPSPAVPLPLHLVHLIYPCSAYPPSFQACPLVSSSALPIRFPQPRAHLAANPGRSALVPLARGGRAAGGGGGHAGRGGAPGHGRRCKLEGMRGMR